MGRYAFAYLATGIAFALIDSVWLRTMSERLYKVEIGELLADSFRLPPAIVFYLLYILGMMIFAVGPAMQSGSWKTALCYGAAFGFFAYMTYDLTNYATLKVWSLKVTILDMIWGTVLTGLAAAAGAAVVHRRRRLPRPGEPTDTQLRGGLQSSGTCLAFASTMIQLICTRPSAFRSFNSCRCSSGSPSRTPLEDFLGVSSLGAMAHSALSSTGIRHDDTNRHR